MTFGEKVRAARKERGLSQKELAARTGIAVRTIINYESGSRMPKSKDSYVKLVKDVEALYAGGELEERDMDAMMRALQDAYWRAKEINRKFVPKKYREEEE